MKRLNRRTFAFSKKWEMLKVALALQLAHALQLRPDPRHARRHPGHGGRPHAVAVELGGSGRLGGSGSVGLGEN